jgi:hypothetical protein
MTELYIIKEDPMGTLGVFVMYFGIGFGGYMLFDWLFG